jgi:hypothetical protein
MISHPKDIAKGAPLKGPQVGTMRNETICLGMEFKEKTKIDRIGQGRGQHHLANRVLDRNASIKAGQEICVDERGPGGPSPVILLPEIESLKGDLRVGARV